MASLFDYAVVYDAEAICKTPLRTGDADGGTDEILSYKDGTPFIQGNSISGALRAWLEKVQEKKTVESLFGSQLREGHLNISDGVFSKAACLGSRTGIAIDGASGTVKNGGKFDVKHINAGERMKFSITWTGWKQDVNETELVEQMLSAMQEGDIRIGAKKTNGFGIFELRVKKTCFDLKQERDRKAWLEDEREGKLLVLKPIQKKAYTEFVLSGRLDSILVKAAIPEQVNDSSCIKNIMEGKTAIIPGSSVKGAIRARVQAIAEAMGIDLAIVREMFGNGNCDGNEQSAGQVYFEDVRMDRSKKEAITRIRINKFTGGVIRGGLFREEPLSAEVKIRILVPDHPAYCMLMLYALRDLGEGLYNLGSGGAIGRGYFTAASLEATDSHDGKMKLVFKEDSSYIDEDKAGKLARWSEGLEAYR